MSTHAIRRAIAKVGAHVAKASAYTVSIIIVFVPLLLRPLLEECMCHGPTGNWAAPSREMLLPPTIPLSTSTLP